MKLLLKLLTVVVMVFSVHECIMAQRQIGQLEPEALYDEALMLYENHHYGAAIELFGEYLEKTEGLNDQKMVAAQFYEAASALYLDNGNGEQMITDFVNNNSTSPLAVDANFLYANLLFKNKKYRDAIKVYDKIEESDLDDNEISEYQFKKALCYYNTNNIDAAEPLFFKASVNDGAYKVDAQYYYAHIQYVNDNLDDAVFHFEKIKNNPKYNKIVPLYLLQIDFDNGNYEAVTQSCDKVYILADKRRKSDVALMAAESWFQLKDYAKSLEYFNMARENSKRAFPREVEFRIGFCKMKTGDYEGAIDNFQNAVKSDEDQLTQFASYYLAQCYINTQQEKFARNVFLKAYKVNIDREISEDALFNYAKLSFIPGVDPFNEAVAQLNEYITKYPDSKRRPEAQELVIHLLLNSKDYDGALKTLEQYPRLTPELEKIYAQLNYNLGMQYYNDMDYDKAVVYLTKVNSGRGASSLMKADATYWLADAYYQKKDYKKAESYLLSFLKMSSAENSEMFPFAYYNFGYLFFNKNDFEKALKEFKHFVDIYRDDKEYLNDAWMRIGDCYFMERNYKNAINAYSNAVKLDSKNADYSLFQQGMGYGALGDMSSKISSLSALYTSYPKSSYYDRAVYETGMAYLGSNDTRSAVASFGKLVKDRPRSPYARQALMKIGMLYYNNDQYEEALVNLKKVVSDYANTEESREALNLIRNIYMETNRTQEYFKYTEENGIGSVSISEQDSLMFKTVENFFQESKYDKTLEGVRQYIDKNPDGAYLLKIHYYAAYSLEKDNNLTEQRPHLEYIVNKPDNDYTDYALLRLARLDYDDGNYSDAASYYERLLTLTDNQIIKLEAIEGAMKSGYFNGDYDKAIQYGGELYSMPEVTQNQKNQTDYIVGKSLYAKKEYADALARFKMSADKDKSVMGAESAYHVALCDYAMQKYDDAENDVFFMSDNFGSHTYWVAKAFLLLGDIYVAKDNVFQAKETLKSIIDNYPGEDLKQEARQKLAAIERNEQNNEEEAQ